jgi:galactokinase
LRSTSMREVRADAPGRVNLIGEHTDYHDGFVLPCAVPQRTRVRLQPRGDSMVRAWSAQIGSAAIEYEIGSERPAAEWGDYIQGLTWVLGGGVGGFDLWIESDVPLGSGLSSSAALEIAALRAMREAFDLRLSDIELARAAQKAEVEFVGAPVGIMDQMASSLAGEHDALFLDTRTLAFEHIPLPDALELVVINSGVTHQHAGGDYVTRRRESEEAARLLGVTRLRDAPPGVLDRLAAMPPLLARRARHVITENERVLQACAALRRADLRRLGALFNASHASMRDDYEVSVPAVDLLVDLAQRHADVFGARMTGGGFGGAIVIAAAAGSGARVAADVSAMYGARSGIEATVLVPPQS